MRVPLILLPRKGQPKWPYLLSLSLSLSLSLQTLRLITESGTRVGNETTGLVYPRATEPIAADLPRPPAPRSLCSVFTLHARL